MKHPRNSFAKVILSILSPSRPQKIGRSSSTKKKKNEKKEGHFHRFLSRRNSFSLLSIPLNKTSGNLSLANKKLIRRHKYSLRVNPNMVRYFTVTVIGKLLTLGKTKTNFLLHPLLIIITSYYFFISYQVDF